MFKRKTGKIEKKTEDVRHMDALSSTPSAVIPIPNMTIPTSNVIIPVSNPSIPYGISAFSRVPILGPSFRIQSYRLLATFDNHIEKKAVDEHFSKHNIPIVLCAHGESMSKKYTYVLLSMDPNDVKNTGRVSEDKGKFSIKNMSFFRVNEQNPIEIRTISSRKCFINIFNFLGEQDPVCGEIYSKIYGTIRTVNITIVKPKKIKINEKKLTTELFEMKNEGDANKYLFDRCSDPTDVAKYKLLWEKNRDEQDSKQKSKEFNAKFFSIESEEESRKLISTLNLKDKEFEVMLDSWRKFHHITEKKT